MKSIFDKTNREEIIKRINAINENSERQWGKMDVHQMLKHCTLYEEWVLGKNNPTYKQTFIGRIFGKMVLKKFTKDDQPFDKNVPTTSDLKLPIGNKNLLEEKNKWISLINEYEKFHNPAFIHDFFGKTSVEQIGILAYKHSDHHLRQFNC